MSSFESFFLHKPKKHPIHKWMHYFKIYEKHLRPYVGKNPILLEIGVYKGGSIDMWNDYFDHQCTIIAIDNDPACKELQKDYGPNVHIVIGDQSDPAFWDEFLKQYSSFDIVIDDGGHRMEEQIITFEKVYGAVKDGGVYICEDTHTSYLSNFGGGFRKEDTFIEYSKRLIDYMYAYFVDGMSLDFRKSTYCISYYDSIVVFDKCIDHKFPEAPYMT